MGKFDDARIDNDNDKMVGVRTENIDDNDVARNDDDDKEELCRARDKHDDRCAGDGNNCTHPIPKVRLHTIHTPAPEQGKQDEEASISSISATKVLPLESGNEAICDKHDATQDEEHPKPSLLPPFPYHPSSTYLTYACCYKQEQCYDGLRT